MKLESLKKILAPTKVKHNKRNLIELEKFNEQ